jgi:hypothetical protein
MSRPRCFFLKTKPGAWLGFLVVYLVMCAIWPELLGLCLGIGFFYGVYKVLGG